MQTPKILPPKINSFINYMQQKIKFYESIYLERIEGKYKGIDEQGNLLLKIDGNTNHQK